jgi:hypothetical protein
MPVVVRSESPLPDATLIIHMGAGAAGTVVSAAVRNYGEYRPVTATGLGLFAVSVFAIVRGITEAQILAALPQRTFARTTVGAVVDEGFELLATSILDADLDAAIAAIQPVHHDIVMPALDDARFAHLDPIDDEDLEAKSRAHLAPHVDRLLALFGPRERK